MAIDEKALAVAFQYYWHRPFREQLRNEKEIYRWKKCFKCDAKNGRPYQNPICLECYIKEPKLINWRPTDADDK